MPVSETGAPDSGETLNADGQPRRLTPRELRRLKRQQERADSEVRPAPARELRRVFLYVRVSSSAGRDLAASTTHTVRIQREKAEELARRNNWEIVDVIEHIDVSGSRTNTEDRLLPVLQRIERGEADGLVVYRLARCTRTQNGTIDAVKRLLGAGAHLKATDLDLDIHASMGRVLLDIMVSIAHAEAENIGANWRAVNEGNLVRGIPHMVGFGYVRREHDEIEMVDNGEVFRPAGSLVKDETLVGTPERPRWWWAREMFLMRGRGDGPSVIRDWLTTAASARSVARRAETLGGRLGLGVSAVTTSPRRGLLLRRGTAPGGTRTAGHRERVGARAGRSVHDDQDHAAGAANVGARALRPVPVRDELGPVGR
jgi:resolvase-like protein